MNIYSETAEKLGKLRRNEEQMSDGQRLRYASVLKKYRREIIAGAGQILRQFWISGLLVEKDSLLDNLCDSALNIINDEFAKGEMKRLVDILFQTYSLNEFLNAACMVRSRILYEAYVEYWLEKCIQKPLPNGIPWAGIPSSGSVWYNRMIDMYWQSEYRVWVSESKTAWRGCLPPTKELCESEYAKERKVMGSA